MHTRFFYIVFSLLLIVAMLHSAAIYFSLYWIYRWFDMPMHFLGGLLVGLSSLWLLFFAGYIRKKQKPQRGEANEESSQKMHGHIKPAVYPVQRKINCRTVKHCNDKKQGKNDVEESGMQDTCAKPASRAGFAQSRLIVLPWCSQVGVRSIQRAVCPEGPPLRRSDI